MIRDRISILTFHFKFYKFQSVQVFGTTLTNLQFSVTDNKTNFRTIFSEIRIQVNYPPEIYIKC